MLVDSLQQTRGGAVAAAREARVGGELWPAFEKVGERTALYAN